MNRLYHSLHILMNWFLPNQKLLHKVRTGGHITKVYDQAQTPEDFRPIPPRMLLYPRGVLGGVLYHVPGCWAERMFPKRQSNSSEKETPQ